MSRSAVGLEVTPGLAGHGDVVSPESLPVSLGAGVLALLLGALTWRHGAAMTPDSWAYWQGSVSLLHGDGYRFFFGHLPIKDWPPGYSAYLAAWQAVLGVSGKTLAVANVALGAAAAFGWNWALLRLLGPLMGGGRGLRLPVALAIAFYVTLLTVSAGTYVLADNLKYALVPWLLLASVTASQATANGPFLKWVLVAGLVESALMLVHNGSAALVAAACAVVLCGRVPAALRVGGVGLLGALAFGPWLVVTRALGQAGSHRVGLGIANSTPLYYVNELARGIGDLLAPRPILGCALFLGALGMTAWGLRGSRTRTDSGAALQGRRVVALCALFAAVGVAVLYVIFNLTWVQDPIDALNGRRYLLFLPLIVVPLALSCGARRLPRVALLAVAVAATLLPLVRTVGGVFPRSRVFASVALTGRLLAPDRMGLDCTIRPDYTGRPPTREGGSLLVSPPLYPWIRRQLAPPPTPQ